MILSTKTESVKMASARLALDTSVDGVVFPLRMGKDEVAVLLSLYYVAYLVPTAGFSVLMYGLCR